LKNQVSNAFVSFFADVMCWGWLDRIQINFGNKFRFGIVQQKVRKYRCLTEHLLGKSIENVARWLRFDHAQILI
jgi:hypothetical protein